MAQSPHAGTADRDARAGSPAEPARTQLTHIRDAGETSTTQRSLTALRIGNFKAFADTQRIPLKPITLIFGPNSAGKSSIIHSLAFAHEAEFGRDKRGASRLDVRFTDIGGSSIDLGGFRQFVYRGQAANRVEWGAELAVAVLEKPLQALLSGAHTVSVTLMLGIALDDQDRALPGADPQIDSVALAVDGKELMHLGYRRQDELGSVLRIERLATAHAVVRQILRAIIESSTTTLHIGAEDIAAADGAVNELLPKLVVRAPRLFPDSVTLTAEPEPLAPVEATLLPVSKGARSEDIARAIKAYLPGVLHNLIHGLAGALSGDLRCLQYLGPIRSLPPRHVAFAEHGDGDWYAGGAYAWDLVRRDDAVRNTVNRWLGSDRLKTAYELNVRSLVALDQLHAPLETGLEELQGDGLTMEMDYDGDSPDPSGAYPIIKDVDAAATNMIQTIAGSNADRLRELVLADKRSNTIVSHRDVGIGISQVLPVLVMAYGSNAKLIAIEQPELHLHPALQAELGDVFIESALGEHGNTFILETHSEHLILRLMRRMRETWQKKETGLPAVTADDVAILYVEPDGARSIVREMPLNEAGELVKAWPGGFFEEGLREQFPDA